MANVPAVPFAVIEGARDRGIGAFEQRLQVPKPAGVDLLDELRDSQRLKR
jgi:hypothetical protein